MEMQLPYFSLLLAAALSTITSSSASYVHPEVAPSALVRAFGMRSSEPAGFEDSKIGFSDSYHNSHRQPSAEPSAEAEATAHFSDRRRSGEPEPAVEVGPIGQGFFKQLMSLKFFF